MRRTHRDILTYLFVYTLGEGAGKKKADEFLQQPFMRPARARLDARISEEEYQESTRRIRIEAPYIVRYMLDYPAREASAAQGRREAAISAMSRLFSEAYDTSRN
jgi:hypothetical protein